MSGETITFSAEGGNAIPHIRTALSGYDLENESIEQINVEITFGNADEPDGETEADEADESDEEADEDASSPRPTTTKNGRTPANHDPRDVPGRIAEGTNEHKTLSALASYVDTEDDAETASPYELDGMYGLDGKAHSSALSNMHLRKNLVDREPVKGTSGFRYTPNKAGRAEIQRLGFAGGEKEQPE